jgi:hypothetical protein
MGRGRRAPGNAVSQEAIIKPLDTSDTPKHGLRKQAVGVS